MRPQDFLRDGKVKIWKEAFAVVKAKKPIEGAFAVIKDKNEVTAIIEQDKYNEEDVIEADKDWKILTFDFVMPFELVGFTAAVSKILADAQINILAIASYSTDHILVKEKNLDKAKKLLQKLGCAVEEY